MSNIPLLPMPDIQHSRLFEFVPLSREGLGNAVTLEDDERHLLMDNLLDGCDGCEPIKHPANPSKGYVRAWNKIISMITEKAEGKQAEHELFKESGKKGAAIREANKRKREKEGGLKGGIREIQANIESDSDKESDSDRESDSEENNEYESESNSSSHNLESSSYSYSQPNDGQDAQQPIPLPNSVKEVMDVANGKGWNVSEAEASEWFYTNIENNKGHHGKTGQPFDNWLGAFHNHLLKQRETTVQNTWGERVHAFKSEDKANTFGDDAELDARYYEAAKQVLCLNLHSKNPKENQRLAVLQQNMSKICKLYEAIW